MAGNGKNAIENVKNSLENTKNTPAWEVKQAIF